MIKTDKLAPLQIRHSDPQIEIRLFRNVNTCLNYKNRQETEKWKQATLISGRDNDVSKEIILFFFYFCADVLRVLIHAIGNFCLFFFMSVYTKMHSIDVTAGCFINLQC